MEWAERVYFYTKAALWCLYVLTLLGVWAKAPRYLGTVDEVFKLVVGGILIYFFNPWRKTRCTDFHRRVVFSSAVMLLLSSSLKGVLQYITRYAASIAREKAAILSDLTL